jgi:glycogen operon protein
MASGAVLQPAATIGLQERTTKRVETGTAYPLGATPVADGVNFALYSKHATEVFLLLFDSPGAPPSDVIQLRERDRMVWHAEVKGIGPGQLYGYKVRGEYRPETGLRFNDAKLLLDPYAKAVTGKFVNTDNLLLGYDPTAGDALADGRDNTAIVPKAIVVDNSFDWEGVTAPRCGLEQLVIYETHLKGFTANPNSGVSKPGTYLGFIEKIPYLKQLGINAVELLPVQENCTEGTLAGRGLTNYWGYNTIGFFAPESSYASEPGAQVTEFKRLVRALHRAGIQVILDVVYNHTAEGNQLGPTLSLRGLDNTSYYRLTGPDTEPGRYYMDYTGCGNTLDFDSPAVVRLVMDSLRYWVETMQVDGFRFDLASVLGRGEGGVFRTASSFFTAVNQDPVLSRTILIAEPWEMGANQIGNFPVDWSEWNGRFRDTARRFTKGDGGQIADLGRRITGSADLFADEGRKACNSVNFITCHDGFTLADLVSYNTRHNQANGENNQDGTDNNNSWNCGTEGATTDTATHALRRQLVKNHLCLLLFSAGTPMILGGDEMGRTQGGNNNAYCQDNETSWTDWSLAATNRDLTEFVRKTIAFTRRFPALTDRRFDTGRDRDGDGIADITWMGTGGGTPAWTDPQARTLCYQMDANEGSAGGEVDRLLFILNGDPQTQWVTLPATGEGRAWFRAIDTSLTAGEDFADPGAEVRIDPAGEYIANGRSTVVLVSRQTTS